MNLDKHGHPLHPGSLVKIVDLDMSLFSRLEPQEMDDIRSMIGIPLRVERISSKGYITVSITIERGPGRYESHSLGLPSEQLEVMDPIEPTP